MSNLALWHQQQRLTQFRCQQHQAPSRALTFSDTREQGTPYYVPAPSYSSHPPVPLVERTPYQQSFPSGELSGFDSHWRWQQQQQQDVGVPPFYHHQFGQEQQQLTSHHFLPLREHEHQPPYHYSASTGVAQPHWQQDLGGQTQLREQNLHALVVQQQQRNHELQLELLAREQEQRHRAQQQELIRQQQQESLRLVLEKQQQESLRLALEKQRQLGKQRQLELQQKLDLEQKLELQQQWELQQHLLVRQHPVVLNEPPKVMVCRPTFPADDRIDESRLRIALPIQSSDEGPHPDGQRQQMQQISSKHQQQPTSEQPPTLAHVSHQQHQQQEQQTALEQPPTQQHVYQQQEQLRLLQTTSEQQTTQQHVPQQQQQQQQTTAEQQTAPTVEERPPTPIVDAQPPSAVDDEQPPRCRNRVKPAVKNINQHPHNINEETKETKKSMEEKHVLRVTEPMKTPKERYDQCQKLGALQNEKYGSARRSNARRTRATEGNITAYIPDNDPLLDHPNHHFAKIQYHDDTVLQAMMEGRETKKIQHVKRPGKSKIDVLGERDNGILVELSIPYENDSFIRDIADSSRKLVLEHKDPELQERLKELALLSSKTYTVKGGDSAPALFRAAEVHYNQERKEGIQFMKIHTDKVGSMVTIYVLEGVSWNFVVVPMDGEGEAPSFDSTSGDYDDYVAWKNELKNSNEAEFELVEQYEEVLKKNGKGSVVVYKLIPGQRLIFDAMGLTHGVIVPGGQKRSVVVFHDLLPQWDGFAEVRKSPNVTAPAGTTEDTDYGSRKRGNAAGPQLRRSKRRMASV